MLIRSDGTALQRPVLSPDGKSLAVIAPDERIHLIDLCEAAKGRRFINGLRLPKADRTFLRTCTILRWSPETVISPERQAAEEIMSATSSECDFGKSWLLLSDSKRLIALSTDVRTPNMMSEVNDETGVKSNILADYDLGGQLGKLGLVEFVFNHRHALVMFEFGSVAAILSLTRPQRNDIPHIKFSDARSLAKCPDSRYFALLRRGKAQDRVTVFELGLDNQVTYKSFDCSTSDAQDVTWCPTGQPLLAVWDSPTYGIKVSFMTAHGHTLRQWEIKSAAFQWDLNLALSNQADGVGLTYWSWTRANRHNHALTLQALANGQKQVLVRYQPTSSMGTRTRTKLMHPDLIDGAKTFVWLESCKSPFQSPVFARQSGTFEVTSTSSSTDSTPQPRSASHSQSSSQELDQVDLIELNSTHTLLATRLRSSPRTLFLWNAHKTNSPLTVLIFAQSIRQVHFHPYLPHVLIILTASKLPRLYAWYHHSLPPATGLLPIDTSGSTDFWGNWLPECIAHDGSNDRCPFLLASKTAFEAGYLSSHEGQLVFESILQHPPHLSGDITLDFAGDESTTEMIETPSRPSKQKPDEGENGTTKKKKARFDVPPNPKTDWADDPIHAQAGYAYAW
ncbi:uncharacterized protein Z520_02572 [Fonsecaea multimorphosa CBS 102226]|uniref:Uncharacterized protein n=1 Tax=Fonsecaea multimorphosa CBS 102226 TaxID=1442371 RepID=A0A0D2K8Q9_9EURO|nr:uncharacterized protein Z520_02572 [Fonsecaea multimorphosa CBS 102226]KIY02433.1 hypothetical protein Z520_02572 [Fonsecaea multimorphosa CBS 102226]OAL29074.1 hypothetical protein AYO22_02511 [Fonsecaea multimorphosa]